MLGFHAFLLYSEAFSCTKGHQHPSPVSFLSLPNLCAIKFSFTNILFVKVYHMFSTDQQKALSLLFLILQCTAGVECDTFGRQVAVLVFPFSTDSSKYLPLYPKARSPKFFPLDLFSITL